MMNLTNYLISLSVVVAVNLWSNYSSNERLKELGYIDKVFKKRFGLSNLMAAIFTLTPFLNIILTGISAACAVRGLVDDSFLLKMYKNRSYSSENVKKRYERDNVQEDVLRDALTLDGADEELIQKQIKKIENQKRGYEVNADSGRYLFRPVPDFTDEEYLWACAEECAKSVIDAIALDVDLTYEQYEELLNLFRKECKVELAGKEHSSEKVMQKVLKIAEQ